jgi:hypothetical protein
MIDTTADVPGALGACMNLEVKRTHIACEPHRRNPTVCGHRASDRYGVFAQFQCVQTHITGSSFGCVGDCVAPLPLGIDEEQSTVLDALGLGQRDAETHLVTGQLAHPTALTKVTGKLPVPDQQAGSRNEPPIQPIARPEALLSSRSPIDNEDPIPPRIVGGRDLEVVASPSFAVCSHFARRRLASDAYLIVVGVVSI